jgi:hypothetical protein
MALNIAESVKNMDVNLSSSQTWHHGAQAKPVEAGRIIVKRWRSFGMTNRTDLLKLAFFS